MDKKEQFKQRVSVKQILEWGKLVCLSSDPFIWIPECFTDSNLLESNKINISSFLLWKNFLCPRRSSSESNSHKEDSTFRHKYENIWYYQNVLKPLCEKVALLYWVCMERVWPGYRVGFCEKLLETFPMSNKAKASCLQDRPTTG